MPNTIPNPCPSFPRVQGLRCPFALGFDDGNRGAQLFNFGMAEPTWWDHYVYGWNLGRQIRRLTPQHSPFDHS